VQCNANNSVHGVKFRCHWVNYLNERKFDSTKIREHLLCNEFLWNYTTLTWHGELLHLPSVCESLEYVDSTMDDRVEEDRLKDIIHDVGVGSFAQVSGYRGMSSNVEISLHLGSTKFTRFSVMLILMNLKAINWWTDKSFT